MTILVTGATGQLGRLVVDALSRRGTSVDLIASVREPARAANLEARGIEVRQGDFDDAAGLARTFAGAETVLIISGDAPVETRIRQHRGAIDAARAAGVRRVVYTSFADPSVESPFPFAAIHADTEQYLRASGTDFTILRNGVYTDNLMGFIGRAVESGDLLAPAGSGRVAFVSRADLAEATATVLLGTDHARRVYELTGGTAVGFDSVAAATSRATNRAIAYRPITDEAFRGGLTQAGLPNFMVSALSGLFLAISTGRYADVSGDLAMLLGRPAEDLDSYIKRALA